MKERQRGDTKTWFSVGRAVYVQYFKDIRQGALQSADCIMVFSWARVPRGDTDS